MKSGNPTTAEVFIDPARHVFQGSDAYVILGVGLVAMLVGLMIIYTLVKRLGKPTGGINAETAILGLPVTIAVLIFPMLLMPMMFGEQATTMPAVAGLVQICFALAGIWVLLWNPYVAQSHNGKSKRSPVPSWLRLRPTWLLHVLVIWALGYIALQGAMFASVAMTRIADTVPGTQPQITDMLARDDAPWIAGYYLLVAVAAPLREELAFRVICFGGLVILFGNWLRPLGHSGEDVDTGGTARKLVRRLATFGLSWFFEQREPHSNTSRENPERGLAIILAALVSTALFVVAHGGWAAGMLPLSVLSLTLTGLYAYTGSIWPSVFYHALHNGLVVTLQFFYLSH